MAKTGGDGDQFPLAGLVRARGRYQIKSYKGRPYASKWPKARGKTKTPAQQAWVDHFKCLAWFTKVPDPRTFNNAVNLTKDTGWYYRDVLSVASVGKLYRYPGVTRITTPTASVHRSTTQTIPAASDTLLTPNTLDWDNNAFWSSVTNPSRLTFKSAGLYLCGYTVQFVLSATGRRSSWMRKNGSTQWGRTLAQSSTTGDEYLTGMAPIYFAANDYLEMMARSTSANDTPQILQFWTVAITPESVV